jgi:hypothetical protein
MLNVLDEFSHECLAIRVARKLKAIDVIDVLSDLFILRGVPAHIRSDNGPEFVAKAVQEWIAVAGPKTGRQVTLFRFLRPALRPCHVAAIAMCPTTIIVTSRLLIFRIVTCRNKFFVRGFFLA